MIGIENFLELRQRALAADLLDDLAEDAGVEPVLAEAAVTVSSGAWCASTSAAIAFSASSGSIPILLAMFFRVG